MDRYVFSYSVSPQSRIPKTSGIVIIYASHPQSQAHYRSLEAGRISSAFISFLEACHNRTRTAPPTAPLANFSTSLISDARSFIYSTYIHTIVYTHSNLNALISNR